MNLVFSRAGASLRASLLTWVAVCPCSDTIATQVFLDDADATNGSLTYLPGSHTQYFLEQEDGSPFPDGPLQPLFSDAPEIRAAVETFVPAVLVAGSVTFRVGQVWHAVNPVQKLRRTVSGSYIGRNKNSSTFRPHTSLQVGTVETEAEAALFRATLAETLTPTLQRLWNDDGIVRAKEEQGPPKL